MVIYVHHSRNANHTGFVIVRSWQRARYWVKQLAREGEKNIRLARGPL